MFRPFLKGQGQPGIRRASVDKAKRKERPRRLVGIIINLSCYLMRFGPGRFLEMPSKVKSMIGKMRCGAQNSCLKQTMVCFDVVKYLGNP